MKLKNFLFLSALITMIACDKESDTLNSDKGDNNKDDNKTEVNKYPSGSIVWGKDTTVILKDHYLIEKNKSLYIEEGATIISSNSEVKPEIIVLGNLYCLGTKEKPVTFTVEG